MFCIILIQVSFWLVITTNCFLVLAEIKGCQLESGLWETEALKYHEFTRVFLLVEIK